MRRALKSSITVSSAGKLVEVLPVFGFPLGLISGDNGLAFMPANSIESRAYKNTFARKMVTKRLKNV
jgi:hypothetical protein